MKIKDVIRIADAGEAVIRLPNGETVDKRTWLELDLRDVETQSLLNKSIISVEGWVNIVLRTAAGKVVNKVEGHNIWTNTGREYLTQLMSIETAGSPGVGYRNDAIAYIGVGTGTQIEDVGVTALVTPVEYNTGLFLAALDVPPTFPLTPSLTTVRFHRTFLENEITIVPASTADITELGLFTNGGPSSDYSAGSRDLTFASAATQAPAAYKSFSPLQKTDQLQLDVSWEIRL